MKHTNNHFNPITHAEMLDTQRKLKKALDDQKEFLSIMEADLFTREASTATERFGVPSSFEMYEDDPYAKRMERQVDFNRKYPVTNREYFVGQRYCLNPMSVNPFVVEFAHGERMFMSLMHALSYAVCKFEADANRFACGGDLSGVAPADARRIAMKLPRRENWADIRVSVMERLVKSLSDTDYEFRKVLMSADPCDLVYLNADDAFWGVVKGQGVNAYGDVLRNVRLSIRTDMGLSEEEAPWVANRSGSTYGVNYFDGESEDGFELFDSEGNLSGYSVVIC